MGVFNAGLHGCWMLITAWVWALGTIYLARFLAGNWRSMRVIDMEPAALLQLWPAKAVNRKPQSRAEELHQRSPLASGTGLTRSPNCT